MKSYRYQGQGVYSKFYFFLFPLNKSNRPSMSSCVSFSSILSTNYNTFKNIYFLFTKDNSISDLGLKFKIRNFSSGSN